MSSALNTISLLARAVLTVLFVLELSVHFDVAANGWPGFEAQFNGIYPFELLQHAGIAMAAIWVAFGIQTRFAAAVGVVLLMICQRAHFLTGQVAEAHPLAIIVPLLIGGFLILAGGGRWSLYRDDYRFLL